jgi:hypothetical protein
MNRTVFIIDGFNLYHSTRDASNDLGGQSTKWLDVRALCESYLYTISKTARLEDEGVPLDSMLRVAEADEQYMRAVKRQERFSSEADSETVFLFAEDVKEARSEFLIALEAVFRG